MVLFRSAFRLLTDRLRPGRLAAAALDLLLPPSCPLCEETVDRPGLLCGACFGDLTFLGAPHCAMCGAPFELSSDAAEEGLCQKCVDTPPPFSRARAALRYDRAARRLILPFKHGDRVELARVLGGLMANAAPALCREADVLVPVPLHRRRLFARRYNQSALLARIVARLFQRPVVLDGLLRTRATMSLGRKSAAERRDEVAGAFAVRAKRRAAFVGRRVLLIDDVMTSGATAAACAEVLLAAGAVSVDVLVAARVPDPVPRAPRRRIRRHRYARARALSPFRHIALDPERRAR